MSTSSQGPESRRGAGFPLPRESSIPALIIAIGGSAGALQPLLKVISDLHKLPTSKAVIVQLHSASQVYSSPDVLKSALNEALNNGPQTTHGINHMQVEELPSVPVPILAGMVYVCEPGYEVNITQIGELKRVRSDTSNTTGISKLFSELAVLQNHALVVQSVGIVLSGMAGSDAIHGAEELKAVGGAIIVQEANTCEFADMPRSVLNAVPTAVLARPEARCSTIEPQRRTRS